MKKEEWLNLLFSNIEQFNAKRIENGAEMLDLGAIDCSNKDLSGALLAYCNLDGANFEGATLRATVFCHSSLKKANFKGANLVQAMFGPPEMVNATLMFSPLGTHLNYGAEMDEACFVNADLRMAMFRETYLPGADFSGANTEGANFKHTAFDK